VTATALGPRAAQAMRARHGTDREQPARLARCGRTHIGVSRCELLAVDGLEPTARGLDAPDGSPVLDVKAYISELGQCGEFASRSGCASSCGTITDQGLDRE
jgi:hypothetical protein